MKNFKYGKYEINIDEAATREYYACQEIEDNQSNRNFQKYVAEQMTNEEKAFFESLCIDLEKLDVDCGYLTLQKKWACNIEAYIIGDFLSYPTSKAVTLDDVQEQGVEILENRENYDFTIGNFTIHINTPETWLAGDDMPSNTVDIEISSEILPWLLEEKCEEKEKRECPELLNKIHLLLLNISSIPFRIKEKRQTDEKMNIELEKLKSKYNIDYKVLNGKSTLKYKKMWVNHILSDDIDEETRQKAYDICVKNKEYNTYLWHIFSFNMAESADNPAEEFSTIEIDDCTLVFDSYRQIAVKLSNAGKLKEEDIVSFCKNVSGWCDFVITADDFSWAYSRTHEDGWCGPYLYQKK